MKISPARIGITFGLFLALLHASWAALVALKLAQPVMDFVFWAHFIAPPYHIEPFEMGRAAILIVLVFTSGLVFGSGAAALWILMAGGRYRS